ncbi:MAG TPA: hypothetical protein VHD90_03225 [Phototrophicaceae bacterium]|nr:hypothetical protein [Phototrophicaceae bacterium]
MLKMRNILVLLGLLVLALPVLAQSSTPEATPAATMSEEYLINLSKSDTLGTYMVGPNGMSLYIFSADDLGKSNCSGQCAKFWPPLTVASASDITADEDISGTFGTITRDDGTLQVTFNGQPLYYWQKDKAPGDTTGQGVTNNWWVAQPATVYIQKTASLGNVLVNDKGMTIYMYKADTQGATSSACTGQCATNWPAVTVADESDIIPGFNLPGKWGTIEAADGTYQVTYNGWPLYTFAKDAQPGDTTGQGAGSKWYAVAPETVVVSNGMLVNATGGHTLYTFDKDTAGETASACTGDCAKAWPVLTVPANTQVVAGDGVTGTLGTLANADGSEVVTYNGVPLYTYSKDAKPGDATGDGVGGVWHIAKS